MGAVELAGVANSLLCSALLCSAHSFLLDVSARADL